MGEEQPQRRHIRLAAERYADVGAVCSVTIAVKGRRPVFATPAVADAAIGVLRREAAATDVPIYAWCVMPDHVHLVLGASPICDIVTFVGQFKNLVQREAWRLGVTGAFWQASFWDHFLRKDEQLEHVIGYVLHNRVRSGLVERWRDYRFSGSLVFELADAGGGQAPALQLRIPPASLGR
jgi:putative transposase